MYGLKSALLLGLKPLADVAAALMSHGENSRAAVTVVHSRTERQPRRMRDRTVDERNAAFPDGRISKRGRVDLRRVALDNTLTAMPVVRLLAFSSWSEGAKPMSGGGAGKSRAVVSADWVRNGVAAEGR